MGTPLKNQNFENRASTCFKLAQIRPRAKISWIWDFWGLWKTRTKFYPKIYPVDFEHWTIWGPSLKIKFSKIGLRHVLSWSKLGVKPKFLESGTVGGFRKRGQSFNQYPAVFNTGPYWDPLKNKNFENRASSCFKLTQSSPRAKISWPWDFWWLQTTITDIHTRFMF